LTPVLKPKKGWLKDFLLEYGKLSSSYIFSSAFFQRCSSVHNGTLLDHPLYAPIQTSDFFPHHSRTKYIADSDNSALLGVHFMISDKINTRCNMLDKVNCEADSNETAIPVSKAYIHHVRVQGSGGVQQCPISSKYRLSMWEYFSEAWSSYRSRDSSSCT
jgi:hypothetical protein